MPDEWPITELFNQDYLHFSAPRLTEQASDADVETIWRLLGPLEGAEVLDLACGHGRIANRLARRGVRVTGLDATPVFLEQARNDAERWGVRVDYVEGDMRAVPWTERFDAVICWFTSFGYFDDEQNRTVLAGAHRALRPGGRLLVELNHKDGLLPRFLPSTVQEFDGAIQVETYEYDPLTSRANRWRVMIRDGEIRRAFFFTRLFSFTELRDWLLQAGFEAVNGYAGDGGALRARSRRMILVATKAGI